LVEAHLVSGAIVSHIGTNPETRRQMIAGEMAVDLVPQGSLAERIRADGHGFGGVLTPTGIGTPVEVGHRIIEIQGRRWLLAEPLRTDFALIASKHADNLGNLDDALTA
jgi:acetate CoA/acetoacetate CoA-transferase alpha subunit